MAAAQAYPVRVDASLDPPLSRGLWLVKWILVIPHYIVLAFLWLASSCSARWRWWRSWSPAATRGRSSSSTWACCGGPGGCSTTRSARSAPTGTRRSRLADDPAYPAHLEVEYPQRLSRGLALVKWWLLAIPQYIIIGVLTGGVPGGIGGWRLLLPSQRRARNGGLGLIGLLAVIAAVVLLVTGRYPEQLYNFVLGLNRWVLRVAGYAGLMTDRYPPFRLDMGGPDPGTLTLPPAAGPGPG